MSWRLRLITIFSTCEKTNCQKVDQPGQACVSHVPRSPQVMILQSFYCKNNYSLLSWDRKWSRPLFWLPPTDSSPFSIPRFSFTSSAIRIALHLALQTSEQPLKVEPQPSRLRKQRKGEEREKICAGRNGEFFWRLLWVLWLETISVPWGLKLITTDDQTVPLFIYNLLMT